CSLRIAFLWATRPRRGLRGPLSGTSECMTPETLQAQLTKYLTDVHSIEQQALAQMRTAPSLVADDPRLAEAFSAHLPETEQHERLVRQCLEARNGSRATIKDLVGTLTGKGFGAFAASQPD